MVLLTLVLLAVAPPRAAAAEPTLVDHPLASGVDPVYLDGDWQASNAACGRALISRGGESVAGAPPLAAKVPGDILTDLQRAGKVKDPYWNVTWRDAAFIAAWNEGVWTYSQSFPTSPAMQSAADCLLVLDGVRMGAVVSLNGAWLANVTDQFLRYELPVGKHLLSSGDNVLTVEFTKDIATGGRSTYSNQIDWAPNFLTFDPTAQQVLDAQRIMGRQTFGFGIWKSVYVLPVPPKAAAIKQLVLHTFYEGGHPTSILGDGNHAGFEVRARLVLWAPAATTGTITVNIPGVSGASATLQASVPAGESNFSVIIPASATETVQLWHPRGNGGQHRYNITAGFAPAAAAAAEGESTPENKPEATAAAAAASTWRMLGFRHVALVTINDTDAAATAAAKDQDGSGQFGMFFRVNGAAVYARGGNKIPMDLIDGRMSASAHRRLVQSAADGNMNMLRVWGGGIWEPRAWFDACDEFGVMLYLDMQFTWGSVGVTGAAPSDTSRAELTYQIERISHHPSVVILDGCNECGGGGLTETFVMPIVAAANPSVAVWPSCPSGGWASGVDRLSGRANGKPLVTGHGPGTTRPAWPTNAPVKMPAESHGGYVGLGGGGAGHVGEGRPTDVTGSFPVSMMSTIEHPAITGQGQLNWYKSEFGCVAASSFESMSGQLPEDQWSLGSAASYYRNWPVDLVIRSYFGDQDFNATGEVAYKKQLYQSMLGQALNHKTTIESWRASNVFGTTIWMFNDLWPSGSWGSIEYGGNTTGQISGGRWKPLQYFFRRSIYADQMATCNALGACYVKNDGPVAINLTVHVTLFNVMTGASEVVASHDQPMNAGAGAVEWFCPTATTAEDTVAPASVAPTEHGASYTMHPGQIPIDRANFTNPPIGGTDVVCQAACDKDKNCLGYTRATTPHAGGCWMYEAPIASLVDAAGDFFFQKPGTTPIPAPPPPSPPLPPPPPAPEALPCKVWTAIPAWSKLGCDMKVATVGSNCLLNLVTTTKGLDTVLSTNTLPFQPPKTMQLPNSTVTAKVGEVNSTTGNVPITLTTSAPALYVTLTTEAAGRFSDNAFLIGPGELAGVASYVKVVEFLPWSEVSEWAGAQHELLKATIRVETLVENL